MAESIEPAAQQTKPETTPRLVYMPFYVRDFMDSTDEWPVLASAFYAKLLLHAWGRGLPPELKAIEDLVFRAEKPPKWWPEIWRKYLAPKFPIAADGRRRNPRQEKHLAKALQVSATRAELGRQGGRTRAERDRARRGGNGNVRP
jgi:hypothetical protein